MDIDFSTGELVLIVAGLGVVSILAGLLAGLLGVGGGIILVPALFWLFTFIDFDDDLSMHMAVATSLATIIATSIASMRTHRKKNAVDDKLLRRWGPAIAIGALSGGILARFIDPDGLKAVFGFVALAVAINLAIPKNLVISDAIPGSRIVQAAISYVIGLISSLMGIGGGTLAVPTLTAFSYPIHLAVGTASAFGLLIAVPAVLGFVISGWDVPSRPPLSLGYVSLAAVAIILPFTTFFAPYGARLAHSLDAKWVKRWFAIFLAITAIRMLFSVFS